MPTSRRRESTMQRVDYDLRPTMLVAGWDDFLHRSFICYACEKTFKSVSNNFFLFPEDDATYHRHADGRYYRASVILDNGLIQSGAFDSVEENVIQASAITV